MGKLFRSLNIYWLQWLIHCYVKAFLLDNVKNSDWPIKRDFIFCNPHINFVQSLRKIIANNMTDYNLQKRTETNEPG